MFPGFLLTRYSQAVVQAMALARNRLLIHVEDTARQPDKRFARGFVNLVAAVECVFRHEEGLMEATRYPGLRDQRRHNARLLGALHHATSMVESGDIAIGRELTAALPGLLSLDGAGALRSLSHGVDVRRGRLRVHADFRHRAWEGAR